MKKSNIIVALVTALITAGICFALPRIIGMLAKPAIEASTESSQAAKEVKEPEPVATEPEPAAEEEEEKDLYQAFLDGEVSATRITEEGEEYTFKYSDLPHNPDDWESYTVSEERVDLDNDGEQELILNGPMAECISMSEMTRCTSLQKVREQPESLAIQSISILFTSCIRIHPMAEDRCTG